MRNIFTIVGRELRAYFISPIAYAVLTMFALLSGLFFVDYLGRVMQMAMLAGMQSAQFGGQAPPMDAPGTLMKAFLGTTGVVLLFMTPMLTMGLFSEEKKRGTMELLLTAPITDLQIVLGKFFAASTFMIVLLGTTWVPVSALYFYAKPASGPILVGYLGMFLYGLAIVSIGMFISSATESQIVAGIITFGVLLAMWMSGSFVQGVDNPIIKGVFDYLAVVNHLDDFVKGVLSTTNVIFYLSLTLLGLFLTYRSIDSLRWRG
ncbi:MAG TPA: ABC transporter permease [Terriglobia bacterium]|nr:ABC transporter permease [Terriglobia bacterium]